MCNKSITELGTRHQHPSILSSSYPFLSCILVSECSVPAVSCWESPSFLSQVHLACALPWSPSDEVRSEFSLFKNSVHLPDGKIWWAESQSDVGKEGEKASGCHRCCIRCGFVKSVDLLCFGSKHVAVHTCVLVGELSCVIRVNLGLLLRAWD